MAAAARDLQQTCKFKFERECVARLVAGAYN
jgi:hypothetical protein